ncbi:hypothetical protein F444_18077 [Phytophthora nicotianae P1976]|uniref:Uncharacterized protein n=1 Tax=Phytophthora nicotianae P1976 TaxID=1317066 RepID=A0A080ZCK6_PHYNI|nr:hypothetical protein F444_18077 [Phytophthora nicotianae P1976]
MTTLEQLSEHCRTGIEQDLIAVAATFGIAAPLKRTEQHGNLIDEEMVNFHSSLAIASGKPLADFVRLVRGQTAADPRPNKDMYELPRPKDPALHEAWGRWNDVVQNGASPEWLPNRPPRQTSRPRNHGPIYKPLPQVWRHIRKVGVVDKDDTDIRIIDDYSFPDGASINDFTDRSNLPVISYNPPGDIARRIFELRRQYSNVRILILLGDVSACGFGWCGSLAWYFLPGTLINGLYEQTPCWTPANLRTLKGLFWCDDHTCIESEDELRCFRANLVLRRAMTTVLGPSAINKRTFTEWSECGKALGLICDTRNGTVTIPKEKIMKAELRVSTMLSCGTATKTQLLQLLGSLRHVTTCCPPARAFYQRLQSAATTTPRYKRLRLSEEAVEDLKWFRYILQHHERFNGIPVAQFANESIPMVHAHMDASDDGLCVLEPMLRQYSGFNFPIPPRHSFETMHRLVRLTSESYKVEFSQLLFGDRQCKRSIMDPEAVQQAAAGSNLQPSSLASGVSVFSGVHGTARAWSGERDGRCGFPSLEH